VKGKILKTLLLLTLWSGLFTPVNTLGGGWGIERGRADAGDVARLVVDQIALMRSRKQIDGAIQRPLLAERQRQLVGTSDGAALRGDELTERVYEWWRKDVMGPAEAIAGNPAASCEEAKVAVQELLTMMGQRQVLGLETEFQETFDTVRTKLATRCREEALDECVATGRFDQIVQTELGLRRDHAVMPLSGIANSDEWVDGAFKQCAIYELHFVSTAKFDGKTKIDTVLDGRITLRFEAPEGGILNALSGGKKLRDLLRGETKGGSNPFLVSITCDFPPDRPTCGPGATPTNPFRVLVQAMELQHREYYVDTNGRSKDRIVGENKLSLEFSGGGMMTQAVIKFHGGGGITIPIEAGSTAFAIAHKKDRVGSAMIYKFERYKRGVYPEIFDFTYADQDIEGRTSASDSTEFKLIHKPEPKPFQRAPETTRKPLKPRPKIGG
jgi:hypothetical protein